MYVSESTEVNIIRMLNIIGKLELQISPTVLAYGKSAWGCHC